MKLISTRNKPTIPVVNLEKIMFNTKMRYKFKLSPLHFTMERKQKCYWGSSLLKTEEICSEDKREVTSGGRVGLAPGEAGH